jgi:phenylacetate-coenzyme A ligase PaaK-like adenylate-forming protein
MLNVDVYGPVYRNLLFPAWENVIRRRPTLAHLERLERTEWASLDELNALQCAALARLIRHAYKNVPFYRERFDASGISPDDITTPADLGKIPVLTRAEASASLEARKSTAPPYFEISKMTSGTTGEPLEFGYDRGSEYWRQATKLRGYGWAGYRLGDKSLHYWGMLEVLYKKPFLARNKIRADRLLRRENFIDCTERSDAKLKRVVGAIRELRPKVLLCYSQAAVALARHVLETKSRSWDVLPVICAAEALFAPDRKVIEAAFGAVFETYGSREFMLVAAECDAHDGMHLSMENLIVELLVREHGGLRPARPGELGEIAVTDLHNDGLPFIRYLTGDLGLQAAPGRCGCGRSLLKLAAVQGRKTDTLRDGQGRPVSGLFYHVTFSVLADKIRQFQAVQRRDGSLDLRLVPNRAYDDSVLEIVRKSSQKFLPGVDVRIEIVPEIPPGKNGKLRTVVVET